MTIPLTVKALLTIGRLAEIVKGWKAGTYVPPAGFVDTNRVLASVTLLLGNDAISELHTAIAAADPRAIAAVAAAESMLPEIAQQIIRNATGFRDMGRWAEMHNVSTFGIRLAKLAGLHEEHVTGLFLRAVALRNLQDKPGAIEAYKAVLDEVSPGDRKTQSAAHHNLANLLRESGQLDEADRHYESASQIEASRTDRSLDDLAAILYDHSSLNMLLGEYSRAAALQDEARRLLSGKPIRPVQHAIWLDTEAQLLDRMGDLKAALRRADEAAKVFAEQAATDEDFALVDRAVNARLRASLYIALKDEAPADNCFREALELAERAASISVNAEHYAQGYGTALPHRLPTADPVVQKIGSALRLGRLGDIAASEALLVDAIEEATAHGDHLTALRAKADLASQKLDLGDVHAAHRLAQDVHSEALARGLALPEAMALGTLVSLGQSGAEDQPDALAGWARVDRLHAIHRKLAATAQFDPKEMRWEAQDLGTADYEMAILAERHGAYEVAVGRAAAAAQKAELYREKWRLANRLDLLLRLFSKLGRSNDAQGVTGKLRSLLACGDIDIRARLVARRALATHLSDSDLKLALEDIEDAVAAAEKIRNQIPDVLRRADSDRQYHDVYQRCAMLLNRSKDEVRAFETLQLGKGRALLDAMAERGIGSGTPPDLTTLQNALGPSEALVDLAVEQDALIAYVVSRDGLRVVKATGDVEHLDESDRGEIRERAARLVTLCRESGLLSELFAGIAAAIGRTRRILLVPDRGLHNLPLHIVPVDGEAWCQRVSIGYLPAACALLSRSETRGGVFVAGDSREDLSGAAAECREIAGLYGVTARLGPQCSLTELETALNTGPLDVVHLAVHGRGNPMRGGQAALHLADGKGGTELIDLQALASRPWPVNLVVLSGCSTGLSGPQQGYELVSVASQILKAGAGAVLACLWPVGDEAARRAMVAFHTSLVSGAAGPQDLRVALDDGRSALIARAPALSAVRDGRDVKPEDEKYQKPIAPELLATMNWASFVVVGNPNVSISKRKIF